LNKGIPFHRMQSTIPWLIAKSKVPISQSLINPVGVS